MRTNFVRPNGSIYRELDDEEDDAPARPKRESAFDYFDDEEN